MDRFVPRLDLESASETDRVHAIGALKYVTLLRCDIVQSTQLVAALGPEQSMTRLEPSLEAMRRSVQSCLGVVSRELGDGILAVFGAPKADERHGELAFQAGFTILRQLESLADPEIQVRIGIHSASVVTVFDDSVAAHGLKLGGIALHLVDRIQAAALPGQIYASKATHELCKGNVEFESVLPHSLKGFAKPVELFRATGWRQDGPWNLAKGGNERLDHIVGRSAELSLLRRLSVQAAAGQASRALLVGPAGIGKTSMLAALGRELLGLEWSVLFARCNPMRQGSPLAAIRSMFAAMALGPPNPATRPDDALARLEDRFGPGHSMALKAIFDITSDTAGAQWSELEPGTRHKRIVDLVRAAIQALSAGRPTLVVFEDIHWMDASSESVLRSAFGGDHHGRLMLVMSGRDEDRIERVSSWATNKISLGPLDETAAEALVLAHCPFANSSATFARGMLRHTGRVPLFIVEVCKSLREQLIASADWKDNERSLDFQGIEVPPTIQGIVGSRIDRLPGQALRLLQVAAVYGHSFFVETLALIAGVEGGRFEELVQALRRSELLVGPRGDRPSELEFAHDLVRQIVYDSMLESRRQQLHQQVLDALEADAGAHAEADVLCHHATHAKDWARTFKYSRVMFKRCNDCASYADAVRYLDLSLSANAQLPLTLQRERDAIDARIESRVAFSGLGLSDQWLEHAKQAESRATGIGDRARAVAATSVRAAAINFLGTATAAVHASRSALAPAEQFGDPGWLCFAQYGMGHALLISGSYLSARQMFQRARRQTSEQGFRPVAGSTTNGMRTLCCMMEAVAAIKSGDIEATKLLASEAADLVAIASSLRPYDRVAARFTVGLCQHGLGQVDAAATTLDETIQEVRLHGIQLFAPTVSAHFGQLELDRGRPDTALRWLESACVDAERMGHQSIALQAQLNLALAQGLLESPLEALDVIRAVGERCHQGGFKGLKAECLWIEACLMSLSENQWSDVGNCLKRCLNLAKHLGALRLAGLASAALEKVESGAAHGIPPLIVVSSGGNQAEPASPPDSVRSSASSTYH